MRKSLLSLAVLSALSVPTVSMAEEAAAPAEATPDWTFPMSVSVVSDYIFRGQSQTWGKPAAQFSAEADHKSGLYAGFFISNVSDNWLPGASVETDLYAGFRGNLPGAAKDVAFDAGAIYYAYPGANWDESPFVGSNKSNSLNTLEAYIGLTYKMLNFKTGRTLTEYFGWNDNNSAPASEVTNAGVGDFFGDPKAGVRGNTRGSYFYEVNLNYEVAPSWNVIGQLGEQVVAESHGLDITYYKLGVTKAFANSWSVGGFYSATNEPDAYKNFVSLDDGVAHPNHDSDIAKDKFFVTVTKAF